MRAIAVWSVIVFHLFPRLLPGGYLGVDMFFVLSGYLIAAIIWRERQAQRFSVVRFYDRRIRRIVPALLVLLFFTTAAAIAILLPSDLIGYARSLLATLGFVSNVYFWRHTNYFSADAATKPLLHLWSLGVEEQFYIVFPLILMLAGRIGRRTAFSVVAVLTLASLAGDLLLRMHGGSAPAFFLLPARAWELGAGALLALLPERMALRGAAAHALAAAGAALLVAGLVPLIRMESVPIGLAVAIGTAMLVASGRHEVPLANRLLEWRPLTYFGLTSYSLYLWHWPLIVFSSYYLARKFTFAEAVLIVGVLVAVAHLSWSHVERPYRDKAMPSARVRWLALLGAVGFACASAVLLFAGGFPQRLNAQAATINAAVDTEYHCPLVAMSAFAASRACPMNLPSGLPRDAEVVLLGNSHAQMYLPVVEAILRRQRRTGLLVPLNSCLPTVAANVSTICAKMARANLAAVLRLPRVTHVIVGLDWAHGPRGLVDRQGTRPDNRGDGALVAALDDLIGRLEKAGKHVILVGPLAQPGWNVPSILGRDLAFGHPVAHPLFTPAPNFYREFGPVLRYFAVRKDIAFARPDLVQCNRARCNYLIDGHSLFADDNHIAAAQTPRFRKMFEVALSQATVQPRSGAAGDPR